MNRLETYAPDSFSTYIDMASNPDQQSETYYLGVLDTCGDTIQSYDQQETIHLSINKGIGSAWNLIWNAYGGLYSFTTYYIYRGTSNDGLQLIDSISSANTSYTDLNPPSGTLYYEIGLFNPSGCSPSRSTGSYSESLSNIASTTSAGIIGVAEPAFNLLPEPYKRFIALAVVELRAVANFHFHR